MKSKKDKVQTGKNQNNHPAQKNKKGRTVKKEQVYKKTGKNGSAIAAASKYRSPVHTVKRNTYAEGGIDRTGINTEYREKNSIA